MNNKLNTAATVLVALLNLVDVGHNLGIIPAYTPTPDPAPQELQVPMPPPLGGELLLAKLD